MDMPEGTGQDNQDWHDDEYQVPCPACGASVAFKRTDKVQVCGTCGKSVVNPGPQADR